MTSRWRGSVLVALTSGCITGVLACSSALSSSDFPDAGQRLSEEDAAVVDRESCPDQFPLANTVPDGERIDQLAERCRLAALATEQKLTAALDEAVANQDPVAGGASSGGSGGDTDRATDVATAAAKVREARARLAKATQASNQATRRLGELSDRMFEARLWRIGAGAHVAAAAAAGERKLSRVGGDVMLRVNPTFEVDFSFTADRVVGLDVDKQWLGSGRAIALIGRGGVALALGAGSGVLAPTGVQRPLITHLGLTLRPLSHLGCPDIIPVADLSIFAEYWHLDGNALRTQPPDSPVFFGVSANLGFGGWRVGETKYIVLDGVSRGCAR